MGSILPTEIPCIDLIAGPGELCIEMPGGVRMCVTSDIDIGDPAGMVRGLMAQVNAGLAPLAPIFNLIDVLLAIKQCVDATGDAISELNPAKLFECIPNLVEKINQMLKLLPPVSIPFMVKSLLTALIVFLEGLKQDLRAAILAAARAANTALRAAELNNIRLQAIADCAEASFEIELVNFNESAKPLSRLILVLNVFLELAQLPCIQIPLGAITEATEAALLPLCGAIDLLTAVRDAINVPELALEGIPKTTDPC